MNETSARGSIPARSSTVTPSLAAIRHDLRTPLNAIIGYGEMLLEDLEEGAGESCLEELRDVVGSGQALQQLTVELLSPSNEENADLEELGARFHAAATPTLNRILAATAALLKSDDPTLKNAAEELAKIEVAAQKFEALEHNFALLSSPEETPTQPIEDANESTASPGKDAAKSEAPSHILVVDDVLENRDLLERRLVRQGHTVVAAQSGKEALQLVGEQSFDLILLDIMMPEMDGLEVLERLKSASTLRHIPVVVISALDDMDSVARSIEMGAEDYLSKPFNPVLLKARVNACLEKKRMRDREVELYEQLRENFNKLQEVEELRDGLVHMVVHDLRTPLTSVITGIDTLKIAGELNDLQNECLRIALSGGHSLLTMINDLLDVSKMESNALELDLETLPAPEVVEAAMERMRPLANKKYQELITHLDPALPPLWADRDKLGRTLINLLGNAVKFTPEGGKVILSARLGAMDGDSALQKDDTKSVVFSIHDTGPGIPSDALDTVFDKFRQVRSGQAAHTLSTGLGLTFCKLAVEAHGGRIWVESELGAGSAFSFSLPLP